MGRGRQKAKQTKVARQLKYSTPDMDYRALERELAGSEDRHHHSDDDPYASYGEEQDDDGR